MLKACITSSTDSFKVIRYLVISGSVIVIGLLFFLLSCSSKPSPRSKQPVLKESSSSQTSKDEEYKRKIAALDKKIQELEKQKVERVELEPPKEVSAPKEVSGPRQKQSTQLIGSKTVTTVGKAYLGSDITLEEAKTISLTDAQSIALNKLGVFVEASQTVKDFRLTQDEVRSITGAIMKSTVIKEEKKVEDKTFIFYSTVASEISLDSLREALENYQNRSKDKNLIQQLMVTVKKLRNELAIKQTKGIKELMLVDELVFSNQRMNEFLTTKMVIDKELEIQNIF